MRIETIPSAKIKTKFKLVDMENGDVVYRGDSRKAMNAAYREYDEDCEGDWTPIAYERM